MTTPYPRGTVVEYRDNSLIGWLIERGSGGQWTHVAMALGNGTAIQCMGLRGVCIMPDFEQETLQTYSYPATGVEPCIKFYMERLAAKDRYDYFGLLADPIWDVFHKDIGLRKGSWNCATFLAYPMLKDPAMKDRLMNKPIAAYTPSDIAIMLGGRR